MKILLLFIFLTCYYNTSAQVDSVTVEKVSIINAEHKVEGIYKTFDEFRRNQPFYTDSFRVLSARFQFEDTIYPFDNFDVDPDKAYQDRLEYEGKTESNKYGYFFQNHRFFGFCKNDTVFVGFWKFHPIIELGHLSLIRVQEYRYTRNTRMMNGGGTRTFDKYMVLDFATGDITPISTFDLLDKFGYADPKLWKEYKKANRKRSLKVQIEYLKEFNERNPIRF